MGAVRRRGEGRLPLGHPAGAPGGRCRTCEGTLAGRIGEQPRGAYGFGYDPLFIPEGYAQTISELGAGVKARISHRAQALRALKGLLPGFLGNCL